MAEKHTALEVHYSYDEQGYPIFYVKGMSRAIDSDELNTIANTFAAAPQLLSALKAIRETYRGTEQMLGATVAAKIRAIDEAIAAADGEGKS